MKTNQEKAGVKVGSVFICMFLVVAFTICIPLITLKATLLNSHYLTKIFSSGNNLKLITKVVNATLSENLLDTGYDLSSDPDILDDDTVKNFMEVIVGGILNGEVSDAKQDLVNEKIYDDLFEYLEKNQTFSAYEIDQLRKEYSNKPIIDVNDFLDEANDNSLSEMLSTINTSLTIFIGIILFFAVLLACAMIFIHANKFNAFRNIGTSLTIAGIIDTIIAYILCVPVANSLKENFMDYADSSMEEKMVDVFSSILVKVFNPTLYTSIVMTIIGVVVIGVSIAMIKLNQSETL